jgi:hypothetical protein
MIRKLGEPIIIAPQCKNTGLWKMNLNLLDNKIMGHESSDQFIAGVDAANAIFDLPNSQQLLMYFHATAGFPTKETFTDAVKAGNYATWLGLTTTLISKHFPNFDKTQKRHMKGQRKGVRSTKVKPSIVAIRKLNNIFVNIYELVETIHTNQMGAFPVTSQRGYRYIMVGIHIDANYIFCETTKNRTEGEMISAYQKIVDWMQLAGLGLKRHRLDNEFYDNFKKCIRKTT